MEKKEDLRIIKTKKNLYEGLLILLKDQPFENVKVSDICQISLVNRSTFYDHFQDKYELLNSLIKDLEREFTSKLNVNKTYSSQKEYYLNLVKILFEHLNENIDIYTNILKNNNNSIAFDIFKDSIERDVKKHMNELYNGKTSIPIEIVTNFYVTAVISVCSEYLKDHSKYNEKEFLNYLDKLIVDVI